MLTHDVLNQAHEREGAARASRLGRDQGHAYGTLPSTTDFEGIVERAWRQ